MAASQFQTFQGTKTFASLDGLRALAILAVIWHHTAGFTATVRFAQRGYLGVDLFFVLSGFLIATILLREARRTGRISLRAFYRRRILRIFPAYWLMLAIVGIAILTGARHAASLEHDLPFAVLYVSNFVTMTSILVVTWSLSTEEQFYLVVPALMKAFRTGMRWLLPLLYLVAVLPSFGFWPQLRLSPFLRDTTFGPIILGVMLAYVLDDERSWKLLARSPKWASPCALALALAACDLPAAHLAGWPRMAIQWSFVLLVACCVLREDHALAPVLRFPLLSRIGVVSYGMYLYHFPLYGVAERVLHRIGLSSLPSLFVVLAILSWAVAEVSYRWYETPFLMLKRKVVRAAPVAGRAVS